MQRNERGGEIVELQLIARFAAKTVGRIIRRLIAIVVSGPFTSKGNTLETCESPRQNFTRFSLGERERTTLINPPIPNCSLSVQRSTARINREVSERREVVRRRVDAGPSQPGIVLFVPCVRSLFFALPGIIRLVESRCTVGQPEKRTN